MSIKQNTTSEFQTNLYPNPNPRQEYVQTQAAPNTLQCTASNAHVQLAAVEYLNISGLVIDFVTSPVRTGNSFFGVKTAVYWAQPVSAPDW